MDQCHALRNLCLVQFYTPLAPSSLPIWLANDAIRLMDESRQLQWTFPEPDVARACSKESSRRIFLSFFGRQKPCSDFLFQPRQLQNAFHAFDNSSLTWLISSRGKKEQKRKKIQKDGKSWCKTVESYVANK